MVKNKTGYDFSLYKESTVKRRVNRRISFHYLNDLEEYIEYIGKNPVEINLLLNDLLINVTTFFRDPEAFESFKDKICLELLDNKKMVTMLIYGFQDALLEKKDIQQNVKFIHHDVFSDAQFSQLDIISCRNLLIYLNKDGQKKILSKFINALKSGGILFLGPSESI